jgi:hypothetical protein
MQRSGANECCPSRLGNSQLAGRASRQYVRKISQRAADSMT